MPNKLVREAIRNALMRMGQTIEQDFSELIGLLNTSTPAPTPAADAVRTPGSTESSFHTWATTMMKSVSQVARTSTRRLSTASGSSGTQGASDIATPGSSKSEAQPPTGTVTSGEPPTKSPDCPVQATSALPVTTIGSTPEPTPNVPKSPSVDS